MCSANLLDSGQARSFSINFDYLSDDLDIPEFIRENNANLRFPAKLMLLLEFAERQCTKQGTTQRTACIAWTSDGKAFIISDQDELLSSFLSRIFPRTKFSSFTRKLYRWGFRQLGLAANKKGCKSTKVFVHDLFRRDNKQLIEHMQSVTAEGTRRRGHSSLPKASTAPNSQAVSTTDRLLTTTTAHQPLDRSSNAAVSDICRHVASTNFAADQEDRLASLFAAQMMPPIAVTTMPNALHSLPFQRAVSHEVQTAAALAAAAFPSQLDFALLSNRAFQWGANNAVLPVALSNTAATYHQTGPNVALTDLLQTYFGRTIFPPPTAENARINHIVGSVLGHHQPSTFGSLDDDRFNMRQRDNDFRGFR